MTRTYRQAATPTPTKCLDCGRRVLAGLDGRAAALPVVIDAEVLTREGELVNIVNAVAMYATNPQGEILRRSAGEVLQHVAMLDMHRVHDCAVVTPPAFIRSLPIKAKIQHSGDVPF